MLRLVPCILALGVLPHPAVATSDPEPVRVLEVDDAIEWSATTAEHLLNRAGFGADPDRIAEAVEAGLDATIERLFRAPAVEAADTGAPIALRAALTAPPVLVDAPDFEPESDLVLRPVYYLDKGTLAKVKKIREFSRDWIDGMVKGIDPLRDRMTVFWHGHFVSSTDEVYRGEDLVRQIRFLRENALGDFETLVRGIAHDPAMLEYLNNDLNVKESPNENWARELMELFTLGVGNYTEDDIKNAARAFSGWTSHDAEFTFSHAEHDYGPKTVLGVTGNLNGDDVIDIVLRQEACPRFLAGKLIEYLEGQEPSKERLASYAALLRENDLRFDAFLRELFHDPAFYRPEILGNRVAAPVEYFVGAVRRAGIEPPPDMLYVVSAMTGQRLCAPPNVKGWEEGFSWISTGGVMQRSNFVGVLLGDFEPDFDPREIMREMVKSQGREFNGPYRDFLAMVAWLQFSPWKPDLELVAEGGRAEDGRVVAELLDRLLAIPVPDGVQAEIEEALAAIRASLGGVSAPLAAPAADEVLRQLVHVILSLPEAQLL